MGPLTKIIAAGIVINATALALVVAAHALTQPAQNIASRPCIALDLTLHSYDGPIVIDGACVDALSYASTALRVVAHDNADGIFRNGFEVVP